jgi:ferredoxin
VFREGANGIAYVVENGKVFDGSSDKTPDGPMGVAIIPASELETVIEEAENCPGDCIHIERRDDPMVVEA